MNDDTIKRSDAIKTIWAEGINPSEDGMVFEAQSHIDRDIRLIPSADRPQGEWIFDPEILCSDIGVYSAGYRCSICGKDYFKVDGIRFCPSCGARMKGADDERGR